VHAQKIELIAMVLSLLLMFGAPSTEYGRFGGAIWESGRDECPSGVCTWMAVNLIGSFLGLCVGYVHWKLIGRCVDGYDWGVSCGEKWHNLVNSNRVELRVRDPQNAIFKLYYTPESSTLMDTVRVAYTHHLHTAYMYTNGCF
jgi:hypothetical protein